MSNLLKYLYIEQDFEHDLKNKKRFSEPKIYDANGDLSKRWYVYFSFRKIEDGPLERFPNNIYAPQNFDKKERIEWLKTIQRNLSVLLKDGFNPYNPENKFDFDNEQEGKSIKEAFEFALNIKKSTLAETSFKGLEGRILRFEKWLEENGFKNRLITSVNKKVVITYLNEVLIATSAKNRNNTRADISTIFSTLEQNEIIPLNFVQKIPVLKSTPEKNKSYSSTEESKIFDYLDKNNKLLSLYVKFISYNFLRPVEVNRIKIGDIDLNDKILKIKTKTGFKLKRIPQVLIDELPDISNYPNDAFLFGRKDFGQYWDANETSRRNDYSDYFLEIKKKFGLGKDYGLYSFRHTFITKLYNTFIKEMTPEEAESNIMAITGHTSKTALRKYLREINAYIPEDYSKYL
ncbi:tyrosine-type recombinase/integrase [Flavobacterium haoranii]|uniref:Phage integrase family protein n=2 Tax=Flavobacterium haoranii TaxID=683124 RepID=A0A1M6BDW1_9FLAO|nr:tyrosine-type recombinase/integrase [Flavobacterium haoranii]SHI46867.1 Phage integrase family protein [Flavobacterium haoranii]